MKINELISELCAEAVRPVDKEHTVDVIKVGNGDEEIKNVGTAMFATPDVIARAKANGVNFLIIHEPLFYTHFDKEMPYELCFKKKKLIEDAGITVFRFHDYPHSMSPESYADGHTEVHDSYGVFEFGEVRNEAPRSKAYRKASRI